MKSLTIHASYTFGTTVGDITFNQKEYKPVTQEYLNDIRDAIRKRNNLDDSVPVIIIAWRRCES